MFEGTPDGAAEGETLGIRERSNKRKGGNVPRFSTLNAVLGEADSLSEGAAVGLVEALADGDADDASVDCVCSKNSSIETMYAWFATSFCFLPALLLVSVVLLIASDLAAWDLPIIKSPLALASGV
jgi:hypothetical protein